MKKSIIYFYKLIFQKKIEFLEFPLREKTIDCYF